MYWLPLLILFILAVIAVGWTPLFAVIIAVPAFVTYLAWVGTRRKSDEQVTPPTGRATEREDDKPRGAWGEPRG